MIDAHTHLENGDLSIEYVHKFIDAAKENGLYTNESEVDIIECELGKFEEL